MASKGKEGARQRPMSSNGKSPKKVANGKSLHGETGNENGGFLYNFFNYTLSPLLLMAIMPNFVMLIWYTAVHCDGSYVLMIQRLIENGPVAGMAKVWSLVNIGTPLSLYVIGGFALFTLILQVIVPGPRAEGPITPKGHIPVYKDNGFSCYVISIVAFAALTYYLKQHGMSTTVVYDHFGDILATLNVGSFIFCIFLYLKGRIAPSSVEHGSSGNPIFDYYWGTELYPRILGVDIKVFTNCRFGLTVWALLVVTFAVKSYEMYGFVDSIWVSTVLQMAYLTKFFWWESGYMRTIDIMVDRAGFYICWGCLVYVPSFYTAVSLFLVNHPVRLGTILSLVILGAGLCSITINYIADWQKQIVRSTDGNCLIWGKKPEVIRAKYELENGETKQSLLLVSGWWGVARHFHYVPELALTFFWTVPALFTHIMPFSYFIFLSILLTHRTFRDDQKCSKKYTTYWKEYCSKVPYKMVPGIF